MSGKFLRMLIAPFVIEIFKIEESNLLANVRRKYSICIVLLTPKTTGSHLKFKLIRVVQAKWNLIAIFGKKTIKSNNNH